METALEREKLLTSSYPFWTWGLIIKWLQAEVLFLLLFIWFCLDFFIADVVLFVCEITSWFYLDSILLFWTLSFSFQNWTELNMRASGLRCVRILPLCEIRKMPPANE